MRVALLSDTHLGMVDARLQEVLDGTLSAAEMILHAGDHVADDVIEFLHWHQPRPYVGVAGNMDQGRQGRQLPLQRVLSIAGHRVGLIHGWGASEGLEHRVLEAFHPAVDVLVFGHSHRPTLRRIGDTLLVNPGSAFSPRGAGTGSVALLDLGREEPAVEFYEVGSGAVT